MTLFGNPSTWLLIGLTWLALMLVAVVVMGLVARGGNNDSAIYH